MIHQGTHTDVPPWRELHGPIFRLAALVFVLMCAALFLRTTGIHFDELSYLRYARDAPFGDSDTTGKPFIFYWINYVLMKGLGFVAGPLKPLTLHLFYAAAFSASLVWAVAAVGGVERWQLSWRVIVLAISPIALLNATGVMMESAALPLINVAVGCLAISRWAPAARWGLGLSSAVAAAVKGTTIPALLLSAWALRGRSRQHAYIVPLGITIGLAANQVAMWALKTRAAMYYGGVRELLSVQTVLDRLQVRTASYLITWLFLAGIIVGVVAVFHVSRLWKDREFQWLAGGSLAVVVLFAVVSVYDFARYCYPVIWVAVLGIIATSDLRRRALLLALTLVQIVQSAPLFEHSAGRFTMWPPHITGELIGSGGTIFSGFPIYGSTTWQLLRDRAPCVWINSEQGEKNEEVALFAGLAFPNGRVVVSPTLDFAHDDSCSLSNTVRFWREHVSGPEASCGTDCRSCRFQNIAYFYNHPGWVRNQICWPGR